MGNTAIVAFRNADGTYDLHRSPDGATNYQLLVPLAIAATSDDTRYRDFVASLDAPESAIDTPSSLDYHFARRRAEKGLSDLADADPSTLLEADPFETSIAPPDVMATLTPDVEHLYVVDDGVHLYYPAWGSIGLCNWFQQTARIDAYDRDRMQSPGQVDALVAGRADYTYAGDDFARFAQEADPRTERYQVFLDNFQTIGALAVRDAFEHDASEADLTRTRVIRPDWVFVVEPTEGALAPPETVSRALYPIHIPFENGADLNDIDADLQSVRASVAKNALYIDSMLLATEVPLEQDAVRANTGEMFLDNLRDEYGDRLATAFLPFGEGTESPS